MLGLCSASEIPAISRCYPYIITLFLFVILQIPTALVNNIAGFMILRFLGGLVGSPPLATGGASVGDIFAVEQAPLALGLWGLSASAGPVLGPLIGGFASQTYGIEGWRWTIWPLLMLSGFTLIVLTFSMPETLASNILVRRAARLRALTGNPHLRTKGELFAAAMTGKEIAMMTFVRPFRLGLFEPIALSINLHIGMVYGVLVYDFTCRYLHKEHLSEIECNLCHSIIVGEDRAFLRRDCHNERIRHHFISSNIGRIKIMVLHSLTAHEWAHEKDVSVPNTFSS